MNKRTFQILFLTTGLALIGLSALALEPVNPVSLCDRFIKDTDIARCQAQAKKLDLDWYAATVCGQMDDDQEFLNCWKKIGGMSFSPQKMENCAKEDLSDSQRLSCLQATRDEVRPAKSRRPAAKTAAPVYQPLEIKPERN